MVGWHTSLRAPATMMRPPGHSLASSSPFYLFILQGALTGMQNSSEKKKRKGSNALRPEVNKMISCSLWRTVEQDLLRKCNEVITLCSTGVAGGSSEEKDDLVAGNEINECFTFLTGSDCLSDPPPTCQRPGKKMAHDDGNFRATGSAYDDLICCLVSPGSQPFGDWFVCSTPFSFLQDFTE